ncbi:MAG: NAD(P)H-dependent oxidoreductase [Polaromonas sp.]|nr:NAD(P)H-dependent oxidoreductase [Polaromonas sp.]
MTTYKILGISGSLRAKSYNHLALKAAAGLMPEGMVLEIADYAGIPLYNQDDQSPATLAAVERLRAQVAGADALLIASPEYNYSVSGVLKNAIDWLSRTTPQPFKEKPVALMSATQGPVGGARNQYELRKILGCLEAFVLNKPEVFIGMCQNRFDEQGELTDAASRKFVGDQMVALQAWVKRLHAPA